MLLSIIIISYNTKELLEQCLESITASIGRNKLQIPKPKKQISSKLQIPNSKLSLADIEIIVVDNNSTDGTREYLEKLQTTNFKFQISSKLQTNSKIPTFAKASAGKQNLKVILNDNNAGFARANNQGIKKSRGEYLLFLNPDTIVYPNTLRETVKYLSENKDVGAITCRIELPNSSMQKECHRGFPTPWRAFCHFSGLDKIFPKSKLLAGYFLGHLSPDTIHEIDAGTGAFLMIRRKVGNEIGWWDEDYFWYGEDIDLCYRIKKMGLKIIFYPKVKITHYHGASSGIQKTKSKANKETKKMAMKASVQAMRVFYQKHYQKKYPRITSFLVMSGINLLEKIRLSSIEKQFKDYS